MAVTRTFLKLTLLRASRCDECDRMAETFERVREKASGTAEFRDIDLTRNTDASEFYHADEHPTVCLEKDGHEVKRWVGVTPEEELLAALRQYAEAPRSRAVGRVTGQTTAATGSPGQVALPPDVELPEPTTPMPHEEPPSPPP